MLYRGILNSLGMFSHGSVGAKAAAAIMFIIGVLFGISATINMLILLKVVLGSTFGDYKHWVTLY